MGGEAPFFVSKYWTWTKVYVCEQQKYFYAKLKIWGIKKFIAVALVFLQHKLLMIQEAIDILYPCWK